jgi:hypothetical protein
MLFERYPGPKYEIKKVKYRPYDDARMFWMVEFADGSYIIDAGPIFSSLVDAKEELCKKAQKLIDVLGCNVKELQSQINQQEREVRMICENYNE